MQSTQLDTGQSDSWSDFARVWDSYQGQDGDVYRREIIIPALDSRLKPLRGKRILDAGCGNGCVSRWLSHRGASVTGIDASKEMVALARSRASDTASFRVVDMTARSKTALGKFDAVLAVLSIQDCGNLKRAMPFLSNHLHPMGRLYIITENEAAFRTSRLKERTRRRWLSNAERFTDGGRQQILWQLHHLVAQADQTRVSEFVTITHFWNLDTYIAQARAAGLTLISPPARLVPRPSSNLSATDTRLLGRYASAPRFSLVAFENSA